MFYVGLVKHYLRMSEMFISNTVLHCLKSLTAGWRQLHFEFALDVAPAQTTKIPQLGSVRLRFRGFLQIVTLTVWL